MSRKIRILVFGSTGCGKTSLCNTLSGQKMLVSDSALGVTFQSYVYPPFIEDNQSIILTDTVGLNESDHGKVPAADAVQRLIELIKESKDGYNLLIHVMRAPRILKSHTENYELFVKLLTKEEIPCILVVTGCENSDPMSQWIDENKHAFIQQNLVYKDMVATCFSEGGRFEKHFAPLRIESKKILLQSIYRYATLNPVLVCQLPRHKWLGFVGLNQ